jgi:hypothetical protein
VNVNERMQEVQDRVLTQVETAQDQVLEMNRRMAEAIAGVLPNGTLPSLPFVSALPDPVTVVDQSFDFAARMMDANQSFYREMVQVWAPEPAEEPAPAKSGKAKSAKSAKSAKKAGKTKPSA